jgi:hypothetical protein
VRAAGIPLEPEVVHPPALISDAIRKLAVDEVACDVHQPAPPVITSSGTAASPATVSSTRKVTPRAFDSQPF